MERQYCRVPNERNDKSRDKGGEAFLESALAQRSCAAASPIIFVMITDIHALLMMYRSKRESQNDESMQIACLRSFNHQMPVKMFHRDLGEDDRFRAVPRLVSPLLLTAVAFDQASDDKTFRDDQFVIYCTRRLISRADDGSTAIT